MASDAHAHPYYLQQIEKDAERQRIRLRIKCAASAHSPEEFHCNETLAQQAGAPDVALCFAVHPQLPAADPAADPAFIQRLCAHLETLAREKRIAAVGETGFDLFDAANKAREKAQDAIFEHHLALAVRRSLPIVLHVRRAMHKIFEKTQTLKRLPAVVFHSYSGTLDDARSLVRRGVNSYFSFGSAIMKNHKNAIRCCALLDSRRLLLETDAPYQPLPGKTHTSWPDIFTVIQAAADLRRQAGRDASDRAELEHIADANFDTVFSHF
jgi:TatD DNase family protein